MMIEPADGIEQAPNRSGNGHLRKHRDAEQHRQNSLLAGDRQPRQGIGSRDRNQQGQQGRRASHHDAVGHIVEQMVVEENRAVKTQAAGWPPGGRDGFDFDLRLEQR